MPWSFLRALERHGPGDEFVERFLHPAILSGNIAQNAPLPAESGYYHRIKFFNEKSPRRFFTIKLQRTELSQKIRGSGKTGKLVPRIQLHDSYFLPLDETEWEEAKSAHGFSSEAHADGSGTTEHVMIPKRLLPEAQEEHDHAERVAAVSLSEAVFQKMDRLIQPARNLRTFLEAIEFLAGNIDENRFVKSTRLKRLVLKHGSRDTTLERFRVAT